MNFRSAAALAAFAAGLIAASGVLAWGASGHRLIGRLALQSLPAEAPAFLRTPAAVEAVGELAREPDRDKGAGRAHDNARDGAHFLNLADDGTIAGGPALAALPPTRQAFETALRAAGGDSWTSGWLPYAIVDAWEQLAMDFAYVRVDGVGARTAADPDHRAWFASDLARRQDLALADLGALAHFVGDGGQPLHVTVHFNGWGAFPDPEGFTQAHIHGPFEGAFVHDFVDEAAVRAAMAPTAPCACAIMTRVSRYLAETNRQVAPLYRLEKAGAFRDGDARGRTFVAQRLAAGAAELRALIMEAWRVSARESVGWPAVSVADVEAGKVDPWVSVYGSD